MQCNGVSGKHRTEQPVRATRLRAFWPLLLMLAGAAQAAGDPVRGYQLYHETPGGRSCSNSACHGSNPSDNRNNILQAANNPQAIADAIAANKGGMGFYADILTQTDLNDLAAYIGDPAAGQGPSASVSPTALSFSSTAVGATSADKTVTVRNGGNSALTISAVGIAGADFAISGGSCRSGAVVAVGQSCTVTVRFAPQTAGARSGSLSIAHDAAGSPSQVALSGTATDSGGGGGSDAAAFSTATLDFGSQSIAEPSAPLTARLSNTGDNAVNLVSLSLQGAQAAEFTVGGDCLAGSVLAAGNSCMVEVTFTPAASGNRTASLVAETGGQTATLALRGQGVPAARGALAPSSLAFGSVLVGSTSTAQTLTFSNTGGDPLTLTTISTNSARFAVTGGSCDPRFPISPGGSCSVVVVFQPTAVGAASASLSVAAAELSAPVQASLSGTGVAASPVAQLSPSSLQFSTVVGETAQAQTALLANTGSASLEVGSIRLQGAAAGDFNLLDTSSCHSGQNLAPNSSCSLVLSFTASEQGSRTATLSIEHSADSSPSSLSLSGTGTRNEQGQLSVNQVALDFGLQAQGNTSAAQSVRVYNSGTAGLTLDAPSISGAQAQDFSVDSETSSCVDLRSLPAGADCSVAVRFTPSASNGLRSATLGISAGRNASAAVALSGTATDRAAPIVSLSPTALNLGAGIIGTPTQTLFVLLNNTGSADLGLDGIDTQPAAFTVSHDCPASLPPQGFCWLGLSFVATEGGTVTGSLRVQSNAASSPNTVTLTATGLASPAAMLRWLPQAALSFEETPSGSVSAIGTLTLVNTGELPASLGAASLSGAQAADFVITDNACTNGGTLQAGGRCIISLVFAPSAAGTRSASLTLASDAAGPVPAALSGTGVAPAFPALNLSPSTMVLTPDLDNRLQAQALTLSNQGAGNLLVSALSATADVRLRDASSADGGSCTSTPFTLEPGASCTVVVAAAVDGPVRATVTVDSNDPAGARTVSVTGDPLGNEGAGGCSIGRPGQPFDPLWPLLTLGAALTLIWRRRRPPSL